MDESMGNWESRPDTPVRTVEPDISGRVRPEAAGTAAAARSTAGQAKLMQPTRQGSARQAF